VIGERYFGTMMVYVPESDAAEVTGSPALCGPIVENDAADSSYLGLNAARAHQRLPLAAENAASRCRYDEACHPCESEGSQRTKRAEIPRLGWGNDTRAVLTQPPSAGRPLASV